MRYYWIILFLLLFSVEAGAPNFGNETPPSAGDVGITVDIANNHNDLTHAASVGDTVRKYFIYAKSTGGTGDVYVTLYTVNAQDTLKDRSATSVIIEDIQSAYGWDSSAAVAHGMIDGTEYAISIGNEVGDVWIYYDNDGKRSKATHSNLPATWDTDNHLKIEYGIYARYTTAATAATDRRLELLRGK